MPVESLEVLENADVAPAQARAIVRAIEIEIAGAKETLATKQDADAWKDDVATLKQDVAELKQDVALLTRDVAELKKDVALLKQDVSVLKQDVAMLKHELASFRVEVRHEIELLRRETSESQAKLRGELLAEVHASVSGVTRQMYLALLGQMGVLLGFSYFFATHVR